MIRATSPVLALFTGSVQSLTRSLSPVDWVPAEGSPPIGRRQLFSRGKPLPHLPTCPFSSRIHHPTLQKAIQYPETCPGSVQWILSEVLRPGHSVAPRHPSAGALPIESVSLTEFGSGRITVLLATRRMLSRRSPDSDRLWVSSDSPPLSKRNAARNQPVFVRLSVQILTEIGMRE